MAARHNREAEVELRLWLLLVLLLGVATLQSCTLVKPVVGVFTGPFMIAGEGNGGSGWSGCDGRVLIFLGGICAVSGLITGVISDANVLLGNAEDPARNWYDPFRTNTCAVR